MKNKSLTKQEASKLLENIDNYPIPEKSINNEDRKKSRKFDLQIKSNVEPRPFSSVVRSAEKSQESNLEKLIDGEVNSNVSDRNIHPNAVKINDDYSRDYSKIVDPLKISSSESKRQLYEEDSSTIKSSPLSTSTDRNESFKPNRDNPSYKNVQTTERDDFFENERSTSKPIYNNRKYVSESDPSSKVSSVTQSNSYKNIPATIDSMNPIVSTPIPPTESNLYSSNRMYYYPPLLPTVAPQRQFEVRSTVENESKIDDSNEDKENTKEDNEEINKASSDDVTMVATSENDENKKYEIRKDEDHRTEGRQNHRELAESPEDSSERYKKYEDKGYRRYAHKYNDKMEEEEEEKDVVSDGTHDNESHQSAKEGAADDASGKGGEKKFEKGGATEQEQEHHKSEGEKEEKVGDVNTIGPIINQYSIFMFGSINF